MGPAICKFSKDAVSQSAREPFLAAWATLSKCLLHIKEDVAEPVTMMNAFKTSHLRFTFPRRRGEPELRRAGGARTSARWSNVRVQRPLSATAGTGTFTATLVFTHFCFSREGSH